MDKPITERIIEWNSARYDQIFNFELSRDLLLEEISELFEAKTSIRKVDAVGDIIFVSIGILWKLGFSSEHIYAILYDTDWTKLSDFDAFKWLCTIHALGADVIQAEEVGAWPMFEFAVYAMLVVALGQLRGLGLQEGFYDFVHAICDSNDTKEVVRTNPALKANIKKGDNYISPTEDLAKIINYIHIKGTKNV